jgi:hypothetical protein
MKVPILVLPLDSGAGYCGSLGAPFHVSAEGATAIEVAEKLQAMARKQTIPSGEVHWIDIAAATDSADVGSEPTFKIGQGLSSVDEVTQNWLTAMNENRRHFDEEVQRAMEKDDREKARQAS